MHRPIDCIARIIAPKMMVDMELVAMRSAGAHADLDGFLFYKMTASFRHILFVVKRHMFCSLIYLVFNEFRSLSIGYDAQLQSRCRVITMKLFDKLSLRLYTVNRSKHDARFKRHILSS